MFQSAKGFTASTSREPQNHPRTLLTRNPLAFPREGQTRQYSWAMKSRENNPIAGRWHRLCCHQGIMQFSFSQLKQAYKQSKTICQNGTQALTYSISTFLLFSFLSLWHPYIIILEKKWGKKTTRLQLCFLFWCKDCACVHMCTHVLVVIGSHLEVLRSDSWWCLGAWDGPSQPSTR